jgi:hypothetical protein
MEIQMINRIVLVTLFLSFTLFASDYDNVKKYYENKDYRAACLKAGEIYNDYSDDEDFLSIYAYSCLESDMVNRLVLPIIKLHQTTQARENAAYFATILYQKKLLYHALVDDVDISYVNLPKTKYILSKIFNRFVSGNYNYTNGAYWFIDEEDNSISYKLTAEEHQKVQKIFIRTYKDGQVIKVRMYW